MGNSIKKKAKVKKSLMDLAMEWFKDCKPLAGKEMEVLNKTFNRMLSKTPTKLD